MSEELFAELSLQICVTGLILYMGFIVFDLIKSSKAGKFGAFVMFGVLGFGALGFIIKTILTRLL